MKNEKNIAILGAGITGLTAAYILSQNHNVTLYDPKGFPADNASFIAGGMLAPYSEIEHMPPEWIEASFDGIKFWRDFAKTHDIDFHQNGSLLLACSEDAHMLTRFKAHLPPEIQKHKTDIPKQLSHFKDVQSLPGEAHLDPALTMNALIKNCFVPMKQQAAAPDTLQHDFDFVIDARGMGSPDKDLRGVKGEILIVRNNEFTLDRPVRLMHPRYPLYIVPRRDNLFMIGATVIESDDNTNPSLRSSMELMSALYTLHKTFGEAEIVSIKAGIRPAYPNNLPQIKIHENIISANGLFRHGYLLAPLIAQAISAYISNEANPYLELMRYEDYRERKTERVRSTA